MNPSRKGNPHTHTEREKNLMNEWFKQEGYNVNTHALDTYISSKAKKRMLKDMKTKEKLLLEVEEYNRELVSKLDCFSATDFILTSEFITSCYDGCVTDALGIVFDTPHSMVVHGITIEQLLANDFEFLRKYSTVANTAESVKIKKEVMDIDIDTKKLAESYHDSILKHKTEKIICHVQLHEVIRYGIDVDTDFPLVKYLLSVSFTYKTAAEELFLKDLIENKFIYYRQKKQSDQGELRIVIATPHGLGIKKYFLNPITIDFNKHYNEDFKEVSDIIVEGLSVPKSKGIVLLHGIKGSGKTSYIKWLTAHPDINKKFIFLPADLASKIATPGFIELLISNPDSIIIIEDGENILKKRAGGDNGAVSSILNLGDGLLSDCLNIQFIITFNTELKSIDDALLRKGRLIAEYKYTELSADRATACVPEEYREEYAKESIKVITLADALNYKSKYGIQDESSTGGIGFGK